MIKKINKIIALSDIHLGEKDCLFNDGKILEDFKNRIEKEALKEEVDELIILGDLFDLSLASYKEVYEKARDFFQATGNIENLKQIVFIPGNHDHHIWTLIIEENQITGKIKDGKIPSEELQRVDLEYKDTFLTGLIRGCKVKNFIVAYPNVIREIGGKLYFFHHGHLLDRIFTPANIALKPRSLQELEEFNSSWIEGVWYHLVQSGRLGDFIKDGYYEFSGMKKFMETFLGKFEIEDRIISRMRGMKVEKLEKEIADYLTSCIDWYKETHVKLFSPLNFVFGHTHRKNEGETIELQGQKVNVYNTGAWHKDTRFASYMVISSEKGPELNSL